MKRIFLTAILLSVPALAYSQDATPSQIKEVTLFSDQAMVKREAVAKVVKGPNDILIGVGAFNVDADSVSAKVFGDGELLSVQYKEIPVKEMPQEAVQALKQKLESAKDTKRQMEDEKAAAFKKEEFLNSVVDFSKTQLGADIKTNFPKAEDLTKASIFIGESFKATRKEILDLDIRIRESNKEIDKLQRDLEDISQPGRKVEKIIEVIFNSKKDQDIKIEASYITFGAIWSPLYKVDVPLTLDSAKLIMFARIVQQTGENWQDIKLSISNVIPLRGAGLPVLDKWSLDITRPEPKRAWLAQASLGAGAKLDRLEKAKLPAEAEDLESGEGKNEANFAYAQRTELPLSFEYELPQTLSIESRDKETTLPLFAKDIKGDFYYCAIPQLTPIVMLTCKAVADKELLSGPLNAYFGQRYVGKTFLQEKKAGEEFEVGLGADREIKVERKKIKDKIDETFFGKIERQTIVRNMAFKITIENIKEKPVKIRLIDNIPVSNTDKIEVKDIKISPEPKDKKYQDKEGVMLWELNLLPKEKKELNIEFTITYPKDMPIYGI